MEIPSWHSTDWDLAGKNIWQPIQFAAKTTLLIACSLVGGAVVVVVIWQVVREDAELSSRHGRRRSCHLSLTCKYWHNFIAIIIQQTLEHGHNDILDNGTGCGFVCVFQVRPIKCSLMAPWNAMSRVYSLHIYTPESSPTHIPKALHISLGNFPVCPSKVELYKFLNKYVVRWRAAHLVVILWLRTQRLFSGDTQSPLKGDTGRGWTGSPSFGADPNFG